MLDQTKLDIDTKKYKYTNTYEGTKIVEAKIDDKFDIFTFLLRFK